MRLVDRPATYPMRCAAFPQFGQTAPDMKWIDTGAEMPGSPKDSHIYLSSAAVREAAALLGYPTPAEHKAALADIERLEDEIARLQDELTEAEQDLAAYERVKTRAKPKTAKEPA